MATDCVLIGWQAGTAMATGSRSIIVGSGAGIVCNDSDVVLIGYQAGAAFIAAAVPDLGLGPVAIGSGALAAVVGGSYCVAVGYRALYFNVSGSYLTAVGYQALQGCTGDDNTAIGWTAGTNVTSGARHTFVGVSAGKTVTTNSDCTFAGYNAGASCTAAEITAVGSGALDALTSGARNTAVGFAALGAVVTAADSVAIGHNALVLSTSHRNTAIGSSALASIVNGFAGSGDCTAVGHNALTLNTVAAITAVGAYALAAHTTGARNVAVGYKAGNSLQTGVDCTFVGLNAGLQCTGSSNTLVGSGAGDDIVGGTSNACIGLDSGGAISTGTNNSVLGTDVGTLTTGDFCTLLGAGTDVSTADAQYQAAVGAGAVTTADNQVMLGRVNGSTGTSVVCQTSSTQPLKVRQAGGTAGTDELQIYHDGTAANYDNKQSGGTHVFGQIVTAQNPASAATPAFNFSTETTTGIYQVGTGTLDIAVAGVREAAFGASGAFFLLNNSARVLFGSGVDAGFKRVAAKVTASEDGSGNLAWHTQVGKICLAANVTNTNGTLASTNLSIAVIAGRSYQITAFLKLGNSTAAEGCKIDFDGGSATATTFEMAVLGTNGTITPGVTASTALATDLTFTSTTDPDYIYLQGFLKVNGGGTFILRFAENTSVVGTATLYAGSWIALEDANPL